MSQDLLMGIDSGLTVTKAVIFDRTGRTIGAGAVRVFHDTPHPRWVERDMNQLWQLCQQAIRAALESAGVSGDAIAGIGVTGHGDGIYMVDGGGNPVRAGILSLDSRAYTVVERWQAQGVLDDALQLTGQYPYAAAPAALLAWMQEHEPDSFARTRWVLECKDWIRYKLTGEIAIDPTEASLSFTNVRTQAYDPEAFRLFGLEAAENMLPPVKGSAEIVGTVTAEAAERTGLRAGTPVVAGLHDVDASAIGTGCIHPGQLSMTAGTFSINQIISDKPVLDGRWACRNFMRPGQWMNMSISPASATNLDWFVDNLCQDEVEAARAAGRPVYEFVNTEISAVLAEDTGVFFLPFIYGSPYGDRANAVFFGLRGWHKRGHLLRAVFEGVAFNHKMHIEALRSAFPVDEVRVTGGGSRSAIWSQIFADAFGLPVVIAEAQETGALGTAFCAGIGVGVYQSLDDAAASAVRIVRTHQPDTERQGHLAAAYKTYSEIAHALQPVWAGMQG